MIIRSTYLYRTCLRICAARCFLGKISFVLVVTWYQKESKKQCDLLGVFLCFTSKVE